MYLQTFEIRVALVGYVSVGKSTVLNALLGDKFSEVSMRRTTAGINLFRLDQTYVGGEKSKEHENHTGQTTIKASDLGKGDIETEDYSVISTESNLQSATSTHEEICNDNAILRASDTIQEKEFFVKVDEPLCDMRKDTQLVLIDIPGVNEAESMSKYKDYVKNKWNTFDCVIVVMDIEKGVNTEEQVDLLRFVKKNNEEEKDIPTIILGNKMDDPEDPEKKVLIQESHEKVIDIFGDCCSKERIESFLAAIKNGHNSIKAQESLPQVTFLPISAMHAFLYRKVSKLTLEQFKTFDTSTIDKIGHEEVGRKWKGMTDEEKFAIIQEAVSDPTEYQERLSATKFDIFLLILSHYVGGAKTQFQLLKKQLDLQLKQLSHSDSTKRISDQIYSIHKTSLGIGSPVGNLKSEFWRLYTSCEEVAAYLFSENVDLFFLAKPLNELLEYYKMVKLLGWNGEIKVICDRMKGLVQRQFQIVLENMKLWDFEKWYQTAFSNYGPWAKPEKMSWSTLSPHDWIVIFNSVLLFSSDKYFRQELGQEYIELTNRLMHIQQRFDPLLYNRTFDSYRDRYESEGASERQNKLRYFEALKTNRDDLENSGLVQVTMPSSLSESSHWGHLAWQYCIFCCKVDFQTICQDEKGILV